MTQPALDLQHIHVFGVDVEGKERVIATNYVKIFTRAIMLQLNEDDELVEQEGEIDNETLARCKQDHIPLTTQTWVTQAGYWYPGLGDNRQRDPVLPVPREQVPMWVWKQVGKMLPEDRAMYRITLPSEVEGKLGLDDGTAPDISFGVLHKAFLKIKPEQSDLWYDGLPTAKAIRTYLPNEERECPDWKIVQTCKEYKLVRPVVPGVWPPPSAHDKMHKELDAMAAKPLDI